MSDRFSSLAHTTLEARRSQHGRHTAQHTAHRTLRGVRAQSTEHKEREKKGGHGTAAALAIEMAPSTSTGGICRKFKRIHLTKPGATRPGAGRPAPTLQELNPFLHTPEEFARLRKFYTECATWPRPVAVDKARRNSKKMRHAAAAKMQRQAAVQRKASMKLRKKLMRRTTATAAASVSLVRLQSPPPSLSSPFAPPMPPQMPAAMTQQQQQQRAAVAAAIKVKQARVLRLVKRAKVNAQFARDWERACRSTKF